MRELVEAARGGDRDAFAELVLGETDRLFAVAHRILRDTYLAEDALQNALVQAWRQLPRLRDPDRFPAWIRRILVRACYAEAHSSRRWSSHIRVLPVDAPAGVNQDVAVHDRDALERAFGRLPIEQRAVFVLHHYVGLPLVDVAESLGIPAGTARSRLHYATRILRAALEADDAPIQVEGRLA